MRKEFWKKTIVAVLLIICLIFGAGCGGNKDSGGEGAGAGAADAASWDPARAEKETAAELIRRLSGAEEIGPGTEWSIIAIARSSLAGEAEAQVIFMKYQDGLRLQTKQTEGILDPERPTDNAKAAIALKMTGGDPRDVEGYDLLAPLENAKAAREQGINAEIWALIAASVCGTELKTEKTYRQDILSMQDESGGITYDGTTPDVDITAMAIQALAPYRTKDEAADQAVSAARNWLVSRQEEDGSFGNAESTAQVILALSALGENPAEAEDFTGEGRDLYHGLMVYHVADGFCHQDEDSADGMATEQALCALDAIALAGIGQTFFMGDGAK